MSTKARINARKTTIFLAVEDAVVEELLRFSDIWRHSVGPTFSEGEARQIAYRVIENIKKSKKLNEPRQG